MVRTKDTIIVLLFMVMVAFLNGMYRGGTTIMDRVGGKWKDVTVELPEISEDMLESMQQKVEQHVLRESDSWADSSYLMGCEYIGNYIMHGKSGKQEEYPDWIYIVDRVWIVVEDDYSNIIPYYYLVRFSDVGLSEAGEWEIQLTSSTPENENYDVTREGSILGWNVKGYGTVEELYNAVIDEQLEQYRCFADIDEEKVKQTDFLQTDLYQTEFSDSNLEKWGQISDEGITEDGMFEYNAQGDTVTITKYVGQEAEVVIPEEIAYRNRIVLGSKAFQESNARSVTLSDSVVAIADGYVGNAVFGDVMTLEKVYISGSVERISPYTFNGCTGLKEVILEEGITTIEQCAFYDCTSLESIDIPSTVKSIGDNAFKGTAISKLSLKRGCEVNPDNVKHWTESVTIEYYD